MKRKIVLSKKTIIIIVTLILTGSILIGGGILLFNKKVPEEPKIPEEVIPEPEPKLQIVDEDSKTRPVAVMINNITAARPYQSGLNDAYIVYEIIVEGGITRMMAVFKDQTTQRIGSIRSARPYYLDYALENDAFYVHIGGSTKALSEINSLRIDRFDNVHYREKLPVSSEHTAFSSMERINNAIQGSGKRLETNRELLLNYVVEEFEFNEEESVLANEVEIIYSTSSRIKFIYNPETKRYERYANNKAHIDYVSKEQFTTKNIITYQVNDVHAGEDKGQRKLNNIGNGTGYYLTNGRAIPITWEKSSRSAQTIYKTTEGVEIEVNDGNTYIQIQPSGQRLTIK